MLTTKKPATEKQPPRRTAGAAATSGKGSKGAAGGKGQRQDARLKGQKTADSIKENAS